MSNHGSLEQVGSRYGLLATRLRNLHLLQKLVPVSRCHVEGVDASTTASMLNSHWRGIFGVLESQSISRLVLMSTNDGLAVSRTRRLCRVGQFLALNWFSTMQGRHGLAVIRPNMNEFEGNRLRRESVP